jgi:excisionase family DNA binding protein
MSDRLLEASEVATLLSVPVSWVRAETRAGRLPVVELGRYRRYVEADVLAWLEEQKSGSPVWRKHQPVSGRNRERV